MKTKLTKFTDYEIVVDENCPYCPHCGEKNAYKEYHSGLRLSGGDTYWCLSCKNTYSLIFYREKNNFIIKYSD